MYQPSISYLTLCHNILSYSTISYVPNPSAETTYENQAETIQDRNNPGRIDPEP